MAKITITIEDADDGVLIVADAPLNELTRKAIDLPRHGPRLSIAESIALAAWAAIAQRAREIGDAQAGELH